jgi:acyl-coenzyme A synthetase/AMP-(fatty) acid ligase
VRTGDKELNAFCRKDVSNIKCPKRIDFRKEFPRIPAGKHFIRPLEDEYLRGHMRGIEALQSSAILP